MLKRISSLALVLTLLVGMLVFPASAADSRNQCVCGGKAAGKTGHTCADITFEPWTSTTSLPKSGNYYLTDNVTTTGYLLPTGDLNIDLNGHNITRKVTNNTTSQVFAIAGNTSLSITDSTANPGTISRDLSTMTEDAKKAITNWGLLIMINSGYTGNLNLYGGIFDSTGCYSYGGSIINNSSSTFPINIYGGLFKGGITTHNNSTGGTGGAIVSSSNVTMYGGEITGSTLIQRSAAGLSGAGLRTTATLTIGGDAKIYGNYMKVDTEDATAVANNVYVHSNTKVIFSGKYTGEIGLVTSVVNPSGANGVKIATSSSANITGATIHIDGRDDYRAYNAGSIYMGQVRIQCECGGKAVGKTGHTCNDIEFIAWNHNTSIPTSGNWWLVSSVTYTAARRDVSNNTLRIDLNGKNLTRKVGAGTNACMFGMSGNAHIVFTDSTETPGTVTRDLTDFGSTSCSNYGMIVYIDRSATNGSLSVYGGNFDSTGTTTTGSGSVFYNGSTTTTVNMYGGELKPGTAASGVIYSAGPVVLMGGKISGGVMTNASSAAIDGNSAVTLGGNAIVTGNTLSNGTAANIKASANTLTIKGTFTGDVSITPASALTEGATIGVSDNAQIQGNITLEGYPDYSIRVKGNDLVVGSGYKTLIDAGMNTLYFDSLQDAIEGYEGGKAVIKLLDDASDTDITITQDTYIDLNGYDIGSADVTDGTLFMYDSQTDDFTVEDGRGYGKVGAVSGDVKALPSGELFKNGYLMIQDEDDNSVSFHRLSIDTTGVALRVTDIAKNGAAVYYQSGFGGDEVIQGNVKAFGIAMGAGKAPDFRAKTYTRTTDMTKWESGKLNTFNGTLLKNIMKTGNSYTTNAKNSSTQVYSQAYIELLDGTRIMGGSYNLSLKQILEGTPTTTGVDGLWETLQDNQKQPVIEMFNQFQDVMSNWKIPYIKHEITGEEIPFDDDGILKILLIGHSLGLDSGYFFPEVYKETTGKDVVLGMIYHSGCRLGQHVKYIKGNEKQYAYYEFDTRVDTNWRRADARTSEDAPMTFHAVEPSAANDTLINDGVIGVQMKDGISRADWDVVIMQAGVFDAADKQDDLQYDMNTEYNVQYIRQHVLDNDIEKRSVPEFGWNITWASPSSDASFWDSTENYVNVYRRHNTNFYWQYGKDANDMYADIATTYQNKIAKAATWDYLMPSGTALHNCKSVMADEDLYRDVIHTNDFGRLMAAYIWTCQIEGITMDDIPEITSIYSQLRYYSADRRAGDYTLNSNEQAILRNAVNAALKNPLELTDLNN